MKRNPFPNHVRSPSSKQDSSSFSVSSQNEFFLSQKMEYIERFLSKFDDRIANLELVVKSPQEDKHISFQKKSLDFSYSESDKKIKNDVTFRLKNLEEQFYELIKKSNANENLNEKIITVERRVDRLDERIEQIATTVQAFIVKVEGRFTQSKVPQGLLKSSELSQNGEESRGIVQERQIGRREIQHDNGERLTEIKLLEGNPKKEINTEKKAEKNVTPMQRHKRAASRDTINVRERVKDFLEQAEKDKDEIRSSNTDIKSPVDSKILIRDSYEQHQRIREGFKSSEIRGNRERPEVKAISDFASLQRVLKGTLRSPDTERKKKNVSWTEDLSSKRGDEGETGFKRKRENILDVKENDKIVRKSLNERLNERANTAVRPRERVQEWSFVQEQREHMPLDSGKEDTVYDMYRRRK